MNDRIKTILVDTSPVITTSDVVRRASEATFGKPLITNVLRSLVVEAMIALALEPDWDWCSADYASWDFENAVGVRLEVKQSARTQSWVTPLDKRSAPSFDIAVRKYYWEGPEKFDAQDRVAQLYVLAYNPKERGEADHRDPSQWQFYVIPANKLPQTKRIFLSRIVSAQFQPCSINELRSIVTILAAQIARPLLSSNLAPKN